VKRNFLLATVTGCAAICTIGAAITIGGPLSPPAGPITSTYKTLTEVEPRIAITTANTPGDATAVFKISQPGSYYLTGNLIGEPGKSGLVIDTDNVTVDLNGFQVVGTSDTLDGINISATGSRLVCIKNGSVRGWGIDGIDTTNVSGSELLELRIWNNGVHGIDAGPSAVIRNCTTQHNKGTGIAVGNNGLVSNCTAQENGGPGIDMSNGSTLIACTSGHNLAEGIIAGTGCTLNNSTARANSTDGFRMDYGCTITGCSASFNGRDGFYAPGSGVSIHNCTAEANTRDGIRAEADCIIANNNCDSNGYGTGDGAGIHTLGFHNRIQGNNVTDADRGIQVDSIHCLIIGNAVADNGVNFMVAPGNIIATIVTNEAELNAANSNANIAY